MSFTYATSTLSTSPLAQVRLYLGDTSSSQIELQDEEIEFYTGRYSNAVLAASYAAEAIAGKYARYADVANEGLRVAASQRFDHYTSLAKDLRRRTRNLAGISVGGRSKEEKRERARDRDFPQPYFTRGQFDFPGSIASVEATSS